MTKQPKISIITINYNDKRGLINTVESVIKQTNTDFEYIIIDGGSSDGSKDYLEAQQAHFDYWVSESDRGIYDAMNKGLLKATGDYIYFLNSGDYFLFGEVLEVIAKELIEKMPDLLAVAVLKTNTQTGFCQVDMPKFIDKLSLFKNMICHQSLFVNKNVFKEVGDFELAFKIKSDYEWLLRVISKQMFSIAYFNCITTFYPLGGASDHLYNTYSVKEIPEIRKKYYTPEAEQFLRRYIYRPMFFKLIKKRLGNNAIRAAILKRIN